MKNTPLFNCRKRRYIGALVLIASYCFGVVQPFLVAAADSSSSKSVFIYPLPMVAVSSCRFSAWETLNTDCKMPLPRVTGADYTKYTKNSLYERLYTVLWGATYDYGWDIGAGGHTGVDIATSAGTPVVAMGDGEVTIAGWKNGWGNVVVIKHTLSDGTILYSTYAHLRDIAAKLGTIHQGDALGTVGATGNAYGNHLHWQVDLDKGLFHPFYYGSCTGGKNELAVGNSSQCHNELAAGTLDPITLVETLGGSALAVVTPPTTTPIPPSEPAPPPITKPTQATVQEVIQSSQTVDIPQAQVRSRADIERDETNEFFLRHNIQINLSVPGGNVPIGQTVQGTVQVTFDGKPFDGNLPFDGLKLVADKGSVKVFPERLSLIDGGKRDFTITALKGGKKAVSFALNTKIVSNVRIAAYDPKTLKDPTRAIIKTPSVMTIGNDEPGMVTFLTSLGTDRLNMPYSGKYRLKATSGRVKFCNISHKKAPFTCATGELVSELDFNYADTLNGRLYFRAIPLSQDAVSLQVAKIGAKTPIATTLRSLGVQLPFDWNAQSVYASEVFSAITRGLVRLSGGALMQSRDLTVRKQDEIILNALGYAYLKAGDDQTLKSLWKARITAFSAVAKKRDSLDRVTRGGFASELLSAFGEWLLAKGDTTETGKLIDETGTNADVIRTVRVRYAFGWKDEFMRYFQPDTTIKLEEALYLAEKIIAKRF